MARSRKTRRRFSAKQLAAQRRFARMARSGAFRKRKRRVNPPRRKRTMAARRRKRTTASKRRRRTHHRRPGVRLVRRGVSVYQGNPRRRARHRRYRRNPGFGSGIVGAAISTVKDAAFVGVGAAVGRTVGNLVPFGGSPIMDFAKGVLVAVVVKMAGKRFLGPDAARMLAAGALYVPFKNAIVSVVPAAGGFLGDYQDMVNLAAYSGVLPGMGSVDDTLGSVDDTLGSYSTGWPGVPGM